MLQNVWRDTPGVTVITADDTWCLFCDPQTKRQTYEWKSSSPPRSKKFLVDRGKRKVYASIFFDCQGIVRNELTLEIKL